jgi:hypothetical protein
MLQGLFARTELTYETPLSLEACQERLRSQIAPWWSIGRRSPIEGRVSELGFKIRQATLYHQPLNAIAKGEWEHAPRGTRICVMLGPNRMGAIWQTVWLAGVVLIDLGFAVQCWVRGPPLPPLWLIGIPIALPLFGTASITFGLWLGRREQRFLLAFLDRAFGPPQMMTPALLSEAGVGASSRI